MNILFMGLMYDPIIEQKLINNSRTGLGIASNILEWNIINSLQEIDGAEISAVTSLPVGNFPKSNRKIYYPKVKYYQNNINVVETKSINLPYFKHFVRLNDYKKNIDTWHLNTLDSKERIIIFYDLYNPFLELINWIKNKYKDTKIVFMIPDLIGQYRNDFGQSNMSNIISKYNTGKVIKNLNKADGFLLITDQISEVIDDPTKPKIVINGIVDDVSENLEEIQFNVGKRIFMYSGLLSKQYKIDKLVNSFLEKSNTNIELWICGYGELEEYISQINSSKIRFYGLLPKHEVKALESKADILINPRPNIGVYTKYSFPSKNLEYLLNGKPVVCYRLDGISDQYEEVFDYIDDNSNDFNKVISKYSKMSEEKLKNIGSRNRSFVIEHLGVKAQSKKIKSFLSEVVKK